MDRTPLDVSPVAELLIGLIERSESRSVQLAKRSVVVVHGELQQVRAAPSDPTFGEYLQQAGRLSGDELARLSEPARAEGSRFERALAFATRLNNAEIRAQKRALWLDRLARSLRATLKLTAAQLARVPQSLPPPAAMGGQTIKLLPLLLDALSRIAAESDASAIGLRLNHRLSWPERQLSSEAKHWAGFADLPDRPIVSSVLTKLPASAPQIAALLRAGLAELELPGRALNQTQEPEQPLPQPPRVSILPEHPRAPNARPDDDEPLLAGRFARVRLDPGSEGGPIDIIPEVPRVRRPPLQAPLLDPLRAGELAVSQAAANDPKRAQLFVELAELWETRIGSLEEATRNLREAAAADPADADLLTRTARYCWKLGHGELAARYARAAIAVSDAADERSTRQRLLADVYLARGDDDGALAALAEAAAEHPDDAWPHEQLSQLLWDRDQLPLAAAHARLAAQVQRVLDPQRALSLYALAYGWDPEHAELANEYADALDALGHPEAAIAIVAQTARNLEPEPRRALQRQAAQRAERHSRRDLCSELLMEVFAEEPASQEIYPRLIASMDRPGLEAEYAAVLELLARSQSGPPRAALLLRASEALARVHTERETSLRYLWLAREQGRGALSAQQNARVAAIPQTQVLDWQRGPAQLIADIEAALLEGPADAPRPDLLARLCALRAEHGELRGLVSACLRLLMVAPADPMATARFWCATSVLPDPVLRIEALGWLARIRSGRDQGRALAMLAREQEAMSDFDAALASAEAALVQDPTAADAAMIVLRQVQRLEPRRALGLLTHARKLLAAPPALLFAQAEAARAAGNPTLQLEALNALSLRLPYLVQPRLLALDAVLTGSDSAAIEAHAEDLLEHCSGPQVIARARDAATRLSELGLHASAAGIAERSLCRQARLDAAYADVACGYARAASDPHLLTVALERAASVHSANARANCLFRLATHHAAHADRAAELRALLRAAALQKTRPRALELLQDRFAASADVSRLLTVLALRLDATKEPEQRRRLLFEMASAAVDLEHDRTHAASYMRSLFIESQADRTGLLFALGGLFALGDPIWATQTARTIAHGLTPEVAGVIYLWLAHHAELDESAGELALDLAAEGARRFPAVGELLLLAERLTLANADRAAALALYTDLIACAMGAHGQRALHYRAGRWLERSGEPAQALTHYRQAFRLARGAGVAFFAIERVARAANRVDALVETQLELAAESRDEPTRAALFESAALACLHELHDNALALRILIDAEGCVPAGLLDECLSDIASQLGPGEREAARHGLMGVVAGRAARAAQLSDGDVKAKAMLGLARLQLLAQENLEPAIEAFQAVLRTDLRAYLSNDVVANALLDFADALTQVGRASEAQSARSQACVLAPDEPRVIAIRHRVA